MYYTLSRIRLCNWLISKWDVVKKDNMRDVQLGSHTVRSHGIKVARTHKFDWLILIFLVVLVMVMKVVHPFYRFVGKDMMSDLRYPFKTSTVPLWALPVMVTFPYAGSFAGLGYLALYLSGKIKAFDRNGHVAKLCIVFLPLLVASLVGISRVDDYRHHWDDVFAGGILGWGPYAYFQMLEEHGSSNATSAANQQTEGSNMIRVKYVGSPRVYRKSEGLSKVLPKLAENESGTCQRIVGSSPEGSRSSLRKFGSLPKRLIGIHRKVREPIGSPLEVPRKLTGRSLDSKASAP
ncbi:Lipid phosphate phosphatase [Musa troglodytarum]|uniref:Lipid phosphate phosphatase n=1 Tax=Musa troglodytarum TaxID=320322 RepID=A0A9E7KW57_9LILI|nr:Lipid phosphate phosphatase [Musa troglodytarum]